jgi:hypothetical protein
VERRNAALGTVAHRFLKRSESIEFESTSQIIQVIVIIGFKLLQPRGWGSAVGVLWIGALHGVRLRLAFHHFFCLLCLVCWMRKVK